MLLDSREPWIVIPTIITGMGLASLGIFGVQAAWGVELFGVTNRYTKMAFAKELGSILAGLHHLSPLRYSRITGTGGQSLSISPLWPRLDW